MKYNDPQFLEHVIGMPERHKDAFLQVARTERAVIMVRATGPTCHGLLAEGYDTKGYRIHGKSCDWGPMAGFVMRDPRLNKYGRAKAQFNREKHHEALEADHENQGWNAATTPLKISRARINWLVDNEYIQIQAKNSAYMQRFDGFASHPLGDKFFYTLIKERDVDLYHVCFDNSRGGFQTWSQERGRTVVQYYQSAKYGRSYEPMLAMTNPPQHRQFQNREHYLNAITGDYDLFAIWPFVEGLAAYDASAYGLDHRPLGTVRGSNTAEERANVDHLERHAVLTQNGEWQGTKLGNITPRMYMICQLVNSIVGRQVLWHSDEAARPFLDDVDLPVIALTPAGNYFGIENIFDFKVFISYCEGAGIKVTLSNAWAQDPTARKKNRLGAEYDRFVPADGTRIIVPHWYNA